MPVSIAGLSRVRMQRHRENMKNSAANELRDRRLKSGYRLPFGEIGGNAGLAGLAATGGGGGGGAGRVVCTM